MSQPVSIRLDEDVVEQARIAASEADASLSSYLRDRILWALSEDPEVPEYLSHEARTKRLIAENRKVRREGKFRSEFSDQLRKSFERGETPAEFRKSVAGYIEEAEEMGTIPGEGKTYSKWVDEMLTYYETAYRAQTWDHDPIEDPLGQHEGIQASKEWAERAERIAQADRSTALRLAATAINEGVVPSHITEQTNDPQTAVVEAAKELSNSTKIGAAGNDPDSELPSED